MENGNFLVLYTYVPKTYVHDHQNTPPPLVSFRNAVIFSLPKSAEGRCNRSMIRSLYLVCPFSSYQSVISKEAKAHKHFTYIRHTILTDLFQNRKLAYLLAYPCGVFLCVPPCNLHSLFFLLMLCCCCCCCVPSNTY